MSGTKPARRYAYVEMHKTVSVDGYIDYPADWSDEDLQLVAEYYAQELFDELEMGIDSVTELERSVHPPDPEDGDRRPSSGVTEALGAEQLAAAREWKARRDAAVEPT